MPVESGEIRLASERVDIVTNWPGSYHGRMLYHVDAKFILVNESGKRQSILVSFPGTWADGEVSRTVDGKPVKVGRYKSKDGKKHYAYTSRIDFAPGQTRKVRVKHLGASDAGLNGCHWVYVLKTGVRWKGRIGETVVSVRFPPDMSAVGNDYWDSPETLELSPANYTVKARTVTWTFKDFEPTEDIRVSYRHPSWPEYDDDGQLIRPPPNPMKQSPAARMVYLQLLVGRRLESLDTPMALNAYEVLRRAFPNSHEARTLDFYIARVYGRHRLWYKDARFEGTDPKRAIVHYTAALKQPIPKEYRLIALTEIFLLYAKEAPDAKQARRAFELLKKERMSWSNRNRSVALGIASFSPKTALELVNSMSFEPHQAETVRKCATDLMKRIEGKKARPEAPK